jgi:hypothetical protein
MAALLGGMGGGGGGLNNFSFKIGGQDAPFYKAPSGWEGMPTTGIGTVLADMAYSMAAYDPVAYNKSTGKVLPGFEDWLTNRNQQTAATAAPAAPPAGFASEAERQAWLNANATPKGGNYVTEWRKRRGSLPQTLLSGLFGTLNERLGG